MISVWGKFNPNTENAKEMDAQGYLYRLNLKENIKDWIGQPLHFYDAFNPGARKLFWVAINRQHSSQKAWNAWWNGCDRSLICCRLRPRSKASRRTCQAHLPRNGVLSLHVNGGVCAGK